MFCSNKGLHCFFLVKFSLIKQWKTTALTSNHSQVSWENCSVRRAARKPLWPQASPGPGDQGFRAPYLIIFEKHKGHSFWPWGIPWGSVLLAMGKPQANGHFRSQFSTLYNRGMRDSGRRRDSAYNRDKGPDNLPNVLCRSYQEHFPLRIFPCWHGDSSDSNPFLWVNHKLSLHVCLVLEVTPLQHLSFC